MSLNNLANRRRGSETELRETNRSSNFFKHYNFHFDNLDLTNKTKTNYLCRCAIKYLSV